MGNPTRRIYFNAEARRTLRTDAENEDRCAFVTAIGRFGMAPERFVKNPGRVGWGAAQNELDAEEREIGDEYEDRSLVSGGCICDGRGLGGGSAGCPLPQ
jgi:hypothetical protein